MITAVDLFCGAGGFSTALHQATARRGDRLRLVGINHWPIAIETHGTNHPDAELYCESLDNIDPRKIVRGRLDVLIASPECTHHSIARGGKPINDQSRASAWHVLRWAEALQPRAVVIENVREFMTWGPLGCNCQPLKRRKGETFQAFLQALRSLGYNVDFRILNAANYGDATTRERLFIVATRGRTRPIWPRQSHAQTPSMFDEKPWRAAREVIDWGIPGTSIRDRKRPLVPKTLDRIESGIRRYWGEWAEPFLVVLRGTGTARRVDRPLPAVTAGGSHLGLVEPFILGQHSGSTARPTSRPVPTICTESRGIALVQPFMVQSEHGRRVHRADAPMPTITASSRGFGIVEPFLVQYYGNGTARSVRQPLDTITTRDRFALISASQHLDITFRMLQPHELAAAMSFPDGYKFAGTKTDAVRQIGNAVPVRTAEALLSQIIN